MNINELFPIKTFNIEEGRKSGMEFEGTFEEIYQGVVCGNITLLTNNNGDVVGGSYETGGSQIDDSIAEENFNRAFAFKPVMKYLEEAVKLKLANKRIEKFIDDYPNEVSVITEAGEKITIIEREKYEDDDCELEFEDLPSCISFEDLGLDPDDCYSLRTIRAAIRDYTGYFVSKYAELEIDYDEEEVRNITYGRKPTKKELEYLGN